MLLHDKQMRKAAIGGRLDHAFDAVTVASSVDCVGQTALELTTEFDGFRVRFRRCGEHYFGLLLQPKERRQLIGVNVVQNVLIIVLQVGRIRQTLIVDRFRLLFGWLILLSFNALRFSFSDSPWPLMLASFANFGFRHFDEI